MVVVVVAAIGIVAVVAAHCCVGVAVLDVGITHSFGTATVMPATQRTKPLECKDAKKPRRSEKQSMHWKQETQSTTREAKEQRDQAKYFNKP